ncbi:hypothetical protein ASF57_19470 [Methylobacterium sp. Leaf117]|nr:hypothetical protein ASF57_19470 [Methylobacterium sp. Leaf117]
MSRIADVLGMPIEQFYDDTFFKDHADTRECLELWQRIRSDCARADVLMYMRSKAEMDLTEVQTGP